MLKKIKVQKIEIQTLILVFIVFLAGCSNIPGIQFGSNKNEKPDINVGFDGLKMEFFPNAPPPNVFQQTNFPVGIKIKNSGAYDIGYDKNGNENNLMAILVLGVERDYNCVSDFDDTNNAKAVGNKNIDNTNKDNQKINCPMSQKPSEEKVDIRMLGKSETNPKGTEENLLYTVETKALDPQSEQHSSSLYATLCYPYQTRFITTTCVDTDVLGARYKRKVCSSKDYDFANGQGAPVAVTRVESRMLQKDDSNNKIIIPNFIIYVENKGGGQVIRNSANKMENIEKFCSGARLDPTDKDFNTISVKVYLSSESKENQLDCEPKAPDNDNQKDDSINSIKKQGYVRLVDKKDLIRCSLPPETKRIDKSIEPYTTPLIVVMEYGYTTSISKDYLVQRSVVN